MRNSSRPRRRDGRVEGEGCAWKRGSAAAGADVAAPVVAAAGGGRGKGC